MRNWHLTYLGLRQLPADLTDFELAYFFRYTEAERTAIESRRGSLHQLAGALHIGFIKMTGRVLDGIEIIPRPLLKHLGETLGIDVPTLASLRALYRRRTTLFDHQQWAAGVLGFEPSSERQQRFLAGLLRKDAYSAESCHRFRCESCHPIHAKSATHSGGKLPPVGAKRRGLWHCYSEGVAVVNLE